MAATTIMSIGGYTFAVQTFKSKSVLNWVDGAGKSFVIATAKERADGKFDVQVRPDMEPITRPYGTATTALRAAANAFKVEHENRAAAKPIADADRPWRGRGRPAPAPVRRNAAPRAAYANRAPSGIRLAKVVDGLVKFGEQVFLTDAQIKKLAMNGPYLDTPLLSATGVGCTYYMYRLEDVGDKTVALLVNSPENYRNGVAKPCKIFYSIEWPKAWHGAMYAMTTEIREQLNNL